MKKERIVKLEVSHPLRREHLATVKAGVAVRAQEGIAQEGIAQEGIAQEGIAQEGIAQEGIAQEGISVVVRTVR
jgi:hypothetical protein